MQYGVFGRGSGLKVSRAILGCGLFGTKWGYGSEPAEARRILNAYLDAGGNFLDTADGYQFGESETLLGDFLTGMREKVVLATKFTLGARPDPSLTTVGNARHIMIHSVEDSLKRLRTDRVDLLWVHMADGATSTDEIMRGLDDLVRAGKVVHLGFSDFPAWRVARAATLAEIRGWAPLIGLQIEYSLVERTPDRELLPMADALELGVAAWSPLGGGLLTAKHRKGEKGRADTFGRLVHVEDDAKKTAIVDALVAIAERHGVTPAQAAIAWVLSRGPFPILGPRTVEQIEDTLKAVDVEMTTDDMASLNAASAVSLGFPHDLLAADDQKARLFAGLIDRFAPVPAAVA